MNNLNKLTIIIPVHHIDDRFFRAIESSRWADRILIVNQGVNDGLLKFTKDPTVAILNIPVLKSFAEMRNQALSIVETDWVFFLDSDEWISPKLLDEIKKYLNLEMTGETATVQRRDYFLGKPMFHGEVQDVKIIRFLKKGSGKWRGSAHEVFVPNNTHRSFELQNTLFHEPHQSIHGFIQKINGYTDLLANEKTEPHLIAKTLLMPLGKFFYTFIVKHGFLDGYRGIVYSLVMALHSSAVRIKRYEQ